MKKALPLFLAMVLLVSVFAGCQGTSPSPTSSAASSASGTSTSEAAASVAPEAQSSEPAHIECWVGPAWKGVSDQMEPNADYGDFHRYVIEEYTKAHPNVTIDLEVVDARTREERLSVAIQSHTQPNIVFDSAFSLYDYAHAGLLEPLNDIVSDEDYKDFPESVWAGVTTKGKVYMMPFTAETGHLGVNLDIFEAAGALDALPEGDIIQWTPEQFLTALKAVKSADLPGVYPMAVYSKSSSGDTWTNILLRMFGAKFFSDDGSQIQLNQPEGVRAMQFLTDLNTNGLLAPGPESLELQDSYNMFMNGKTAVSAFGNISYGNLTSGWKDGSLKKFNFKWAYFPSVGDPMCFCYIKGSIVFTVDNKVNQQASKDFVRFYSTAPYTESSVALSPVRYSVSSTVKDPMSKMIADSLKYAVNFNSQVPGYLEIRSLFFPQLQAAFTGQKTAQQAMEDFTKAGNETLKKNIARSVILKN